MQLGSSLLFAKCESRLLVLLAEGGNDLSVEDQQQIWAEQDHSDYSALLAGYFIREHDPDPVKARVVARTLRARLPSSDPWFAGAGYSLLAWLDEWGREGNPPVADSTIDALSHATAVQPLWVQGWLQLFDARRSRGEYQFAREVRSQLALLPRFDTAALGKIELAFEICFTGRVGWGASNVAALPRD